MKIKNLWLLQDRMKRLKISFKRPLTSLIIITGFIAIFYVVLVSFYKTPTHISLYPFRNALEQTQSATVKGIVATQSPSIPGEPINWQMIVPASAVLAGQHLIEIPKSARQIKITPIVASTITSTTTKVLANKAISKPNKVGLLSSENLTKQERLKLSELSMQISRSSDSLALAQTLDKKNKDNVNDVLAQGHLAGFFTKTWNLFADMGSKMIATVEAAVQDIPTPPETIVVDIAPQPESPQQTDVSPDIQTQTETLIEPTVSEATSTSDISSATTSTSTELLDTNTSTTTILDDVDSNSANTNIGIGTATNTNTNTEFATNTANTNNTIKTQATTTLTKNTDVLVEYQTPAPTIAEVQTDTGKIVTVSDDAGNAEGQPHTTNVLAFTNIPEIYKVGQESKIKIKWLNNNNQDVQFHAYDLDGDGKLDYVEWTVPHLSTQTFEIIFITKALEMDEKGEIIGDIYDQVKNQDNNWANITDGHTVRVTFEKFLTNKNDNTIYARPSQTGSSSSAVSAKIDVYPVYDGVASEQSVATFENIDTEKMYKILLTNLPHSTNTFDLKVIGSVDLDYIVDPAPITVTDTFHDTTKIASYNNVVIDTTNGLITLAASSSWVCGSTLVDSRDGKTYATVLIGSQCWMQQNLNVGTMVTGVTTQGTSSVSIQKYCYGDLGSGCTSGGGLYQWNQTMTGTTTAGAKGICPVGWHVPTHDEFTVLERATCTSGTCATNFPYDTSTTGWRGTNEGTTMKNMSGFFRGVLSGYRFSGGAFGGGGTSAYLWSSGASGASAWGRYLDSGYTGVYRSTSAEAYGFSVRCLKN